MASITNWLKGRLALGEDVEELAKFADAHDKETGRLIRELGALLLKKKAA